MAARKKAARRKATRRKTAPSAAAKPKRKLSRKAKLAISEANRERWARYRESTNYNERKRLLGGNRTPAKVKR